MEIQLLITLLLLGLLLDGFEWWGSVVRVNGDLHSADGSSKTTYSSIADGKEVVGFLLVWDMGLAFYFKRNCVPRNGCMIFLCLVYQYPAFIQQGQN